MIQPFSSVFIHGNIFIINKLLKTAWGRENYSTILIDLQNLDFVAFLINNFISSIASKPINIRLIRTGS